MRLQKKSVVVLIILCFYTFSEGNAQSCSEVLNRAREQFNKGHFYGLPALLKPCLDNGFNRDQRIEAYWLLTRTYLYIDDPISAEDSYLKLLGEDYEYNIDEENDPIEMVYLSKKFKTTPIFMLNAKIGANISSVHIIHDYGVDNTYTSPELYFKEFAYHFGLGGEVNVNDHWSFGVEANFYTNKYSYRNVLFGSDQQTFTELQTGINFPGYLKYRYDFRKLRPYIYAGFGFSRMLTAQANVKLIDRATSVSEDQQETPVTGPELNIKDQREIINTFALAGLGLNYRIGYNYIVLDLRYCAGFSNIINEEHQYSNNSLLYRYGYVDDDKRLNNYSVSIGFVKPLYKPRKIKNTPPSDFFSKLFNFLR